MEIIILVKEYSFLHAAPYIDHFNVDQYSILMLTYLFSTDNMLTFL